MIRGILIVLAIIFGFAMLAAAGENRQENQQAENRDEVNATVEASQGTKLDQLIEVTGNMVTKVGEIDTRLGNIEDRVSNLENGLLPTAVPTLAPGTTSDSGGSGQIPASTGNGNNCRMDQIASAYEVQNAGTQRIVVGSDLNPQVLVYYTQPGEPMVTYIIGPQATPKDWNGYGYIYEKSGDCSDEDLISFARSKSQLMIDSGHTGLTVDLRDGTYWNDGTLTDEDCKALIAQHANYT